jgi:hypothetical protein
MEAPRTGSLAVSDAELDKRVRGHLEDGEQTLGSLMRRLNHQFSAAEIQNALTALDAHEEKWQIGQEGRGFVTSVYSLQRNE